MKPLADTLAELAADPPTPEQRARFSERFVAQFARPSRQRGIWCRRGEHAKCRDARCQCSCTHHEEATR